MKPIHKGYVKYFNNGRLTMTQNDISIILMKLLPNLFNELTIDLAVRIVKLQEKPQLR